MVNVIGVENSTIPETVSLEFRLFPFWLGQSIVFFLKAATRILAAGFVVVDGNGISYISHM